MDVKELHQRTPEELRRMAADLRLELRSMRFKASTRQLAKTHSLGEKKRDLARVLTLLKTTKEKNV